MKYQGACACQSVRWEVNENPLRNVICHCRDCQIALSGPYMATISFDYDKVNWQGEINHYQSSHHTRRGFCPKCGTRLYYHDKRWGNEMHVMAATLDDQSLYQPHCQSMLREKAPWLDRLDHIPQNQGFSKEPKTL